MGSRERRRAQRRKRKRRASAAETYAAEGDAGDAGSQPVSRSETRNREARAALEPLREGERPTVVTVGAVVSGLIALSVVIAYAAGAEVEGERPRLAQVLAPTVLMGAMSIGMWRARYWAVLGFQAALALLMVAAALGLVQATGLAQTVGNLVVLVVAGAFFYFMVKAMARIQMPQRPSRE